MLVSERKAKEPVRVRMPSDAYGALKRYHRKRKEHFLVLTLDGAHVIHSIRIATIGTVNRSIVHPREVFIEAIRDNAAAVIVAHNHPSGNVEPSFEDREVTRRLKEAGNTLGIPVLDHLVFSWRGFYSLLEHDEL
ncbi:MAG: JAB domain-containing protein [Spirochaetota bacterium]